MQQQCSCLDDHHIMVEEEMAFWEVKYLDFLVIDILPETTFQRKICQSIL